MEKVVKALQACTIKTREDNVRLEAGEVATVKFGNNAEFMAHAQSGFFIEWFKAPKEPIPVIPPEVDPEDIEVEEIKLVEVEDIFPAEVEEDTFESVSETTDESEEVITPTASISVDGTMERLLEQENAKGRPYKCLNEGCDRTRRRNQLYCSVCRGKDD